MLAGICKAFYLNVSPMQASKDSVVKIKVWQVTIDAQMTRRRTHISTGSGFVLDAQGHIVSCSVRAPGFGPSYLV
jgi:hypothetical protein